MSGSSANESGLTQILFALMEFLLLTSGHNFENVKYIYITK